MTNQETDGREGLPDWQEAPAFVLPTGETVTGRWRELPGAGAGEPAGVEWSFLHEGRLLEVTFRRTEEEVLRIRHAGCHPRPASGGAGTTTARLDVPYFDDRAWMPRGAAPGIAGPPPSQPPGFFVASVRGPSRIPPERDWLRTYREVEVVLDLERRALSLVEQPVAEGD